MNEGSRNGAVDGRSLPGELYALAAWKAKRWKTANPFFYTPIPAESAMWKAIILGWRYTTFSTMREDELLLSPQPLLLILHLVGR
jgi:hypothetical protein